MEDTTLEIKQNSHGDNVIIIDGYEVPNITVYDHGETWGLTLDRRFGAPSIPKDDALPILWFIANAMAVAAGYTSFGEHSRKLNPYNCSFETEMKPASEGA